MVKKIPIRIISILILLAQSFSQTPILYRDDFEYPLDNINLHQNYHIWENGALLNIFIEEDNVNSGNKALGVEIISPNPQNNATTGSIFHSLDFLNGDWSGAGGVRFWVSNPNELSILISFNLKERYREYWAVAEAGVFYFLNDDGTTHQQDINYNSLTIPPNFQGWVVLPFNSLAVPEWNTAQSNDVLDLQRIESYAFSVTVGDQIPLRFYLDDIEVFEQEVFYTLSVSGEQNIQIPASGELLQDFTASLGTLEDTTQKEVDVEWSLNEPHDPLISITNTGQLRIPAETSPGHFTISATYETPEFGLINTHTIHLIQEDFPSQQETPEVEPTATVVDQVSAYDRFSAQFDKWTTENRALFVAILIVGLMLFLTILSSIQRKLK